MNRRDLLLGTSSLLAAAATRGLGQESTPRAPETVLVAGATGSIGRFVVQHLLAGGHAVRGLTRHPDQAQEREPRVQWTQGDFQLPDSLEGVANGVDRIVFAAGSKSWEDPSNSPELVDFGGVRELCERGKRAGVKRMVVISSVGTHNPLKQASDHLRNVLKWKAKAEEHLRASGLEHSILRPLGMWNRPGGELGVAVVSGDTVRASVTISRQDLAVVAAECAFLEGAVNKSFELFNAATFELDSWKADLAKLPANAPAMQATDGE